MIPQLIQDLINSLLNEKNVNVKYNKYLVLISIKDAIEKAIKQYEKNLK